jgi:hypothetical protein
MKIIVKITPEASVKSMNMIDHLNNKEYRLDVVPNIGDFILIGGLERGADPIQYQLKVSGRYIDSFNRFVEIWI